MLQEATDSGELRVSEALRSLASCFPAPRQVDEVIDAVGLGGKGGVRISTLSGGQRRRLDVALGIIGNPEVLFLDEPTTGFDPEARRQFWDLIRQLSSGGTTIVLTTHYLDEAEQLADRIGVINHGRLIAEGSPQDIGGPGLRVPRVRWRDASGLREVVTEQPAALVTFAVRRRRNRAGGARRRTSQPGRHLPPADRRRRWGRASRQYPNGD